MASSTLIKGFLLVFIAQMPMVASRNRAVSRTDLELMNQNATYQVEQLLLKDYNRAVGAMKLLNSETDKCKNVIEGLCKACAGDRQLSLEKKIIKGVTNIGEKVEKYGKKYGKELAKSVKKVLLKVKRVFRKPVKAVRDLLKKATQVLKRGFKAVSRGVIRQFRRRRFSFRRARLPRVQRVVRRFRFRRFRVPRVRLPRVRRPRIRLPRVRLPRVRRPHIRLPRVRLPRVRRPRIRLPRVRLPRVRRQRFRLPRVRRVRIPRVRVRFGRRWGKKKKRELAVKSLEDYINEAYVEQELPEHRLAKRMSPSCSACEKDANILFKGVCGRTMKQLRQLEGVLNKLRVVEKSVERTAIIQSVEFDTRRLSIDYRTGMATFSGVSVKGSLGGQSLSLRSRVSYSFGDDERTLVAKGETIAKEIYARHMWSAYRVLNAINGK